MAWIPDLSTRSRLPELMDDPQCDPVLLKRTLQQFARINRHVARYRFILKKWVIPVMEQHPSRTYHLLDMGAGGCDIDRWLLREVEKRKLSLHLTVADLDARAIQLAQDALAGFEQVTFLQTNLLTDPPKQSYDFVFANHFLHHLSDEQIIQLFKIWIPAVKKKLIFSDLERALLPWLGYGVYSLFFTRSFARYDGLLSIRRGFKPAELLSLAQQAIPGSTVTLTQLLPGRLVLTL